MNEHAASLWARALRAVQTAEMLCSTDPNAAASRAYYAAFYAVSCLLSEQQKVLTRHKAVEIFVHRDLVKSGLVDEEVGQAYSKLFLQRQVADYGGDEDISTDGARDAVAKAQVVVQAIDHLLQLRP